MPETEPKELPCDPENPIVLVPLHHYPEFTFPCATLVNMEWPRSRQARLNSLWSCSNKFPVAMVLIQCDDREVIGYCKLSLIPGVTEACYVESVVIHPNMRGKGLGTLLMTKLEDYVRSRKLTTMYLSTMGQEKFYRKLGYIECEPVSLYAFSLNFQKPRRRRKLRPKNKSTGTSSNGTHTGVGTAKSASAQSPSNASSSQLPSSKTSSSKPSSVTSSPPPPSKPSSPQSLPSPPPPPPPPPPPKKLLGESVMTKRTYMKKELKLDGREECDLTII